ncbi:Methyl-accepting chemotaxis protein CtpH [Marinomonas gallaica]|uniref:Methyl-accepting chemotaxis protein CtpH n=1 Tax=Marinomonas gallaica TaxID=1806667 RepID=A0A1C3JS14_9GAMM|nr:HAMP domain-containing methyl-accepting chemotaxis protein [Marinomonas gallaica]SBT18004.1 Methyl-accepting chemotaxis protein CtpH [Marinomonas gallaica]SBT19888.1 Methyl-accepting chemotaxis protein CtpH [Marinomonas gallaica]
MLANFSFRAKLTILLACGLLGFVVVTVVALNGMNAQTSASERFEVMTKVQNDLSSLVIANMELYEQLDKLNDNSYSAFLEELKTKENRFSALIAEDAEMVNHPQTETTLANISDLLNQYSRTLEELVNLNQLLGFNASSGMKGEIVALGEVVIEKVSFLSLVKQEFLPVREAEKNFVFEPTSENKEVFEERYKKFYQRVVNFGLEERFGDVVVAYYDKVQLYANTVGSLETLQQKFRDVRTKYNDATNRAQELLKQAVVEARQQAAAQSKQASISVIVVSIIVAVIAGLLMMAIGRSVNQTLNQIIRDLSKVKGGDLTARLTINHKRNDEFDSLCGSVNEMTTGLGSVIGDVVHTTGDVSNMVSQLNSAVVNIADSNRSVSEQTNSLAAATEEISTTISSISHTTEELSDQSKNTYESAKVGSETIKGALSSLGKTIEVVNLTGRQLNELGQLSKDIDDVIGMINDLANQTNLLALNAAIEAARAGEAGRGFSVVADEVRSLAEKTVDATAKITDIVGTIQTSTQTAITTMNSGQENLRSIEEYSEKAELAIREIEHNAQTSSLSSVDMARSIQEVAKTAVHMSEEMDRIAQQLQRDSSDIGSIEGNTRDIHDQVSSLEKKTSMFTTK